MVLVQTCCRFISLSIGSLAIGIFIVVSSLLGIIYIVDLSDDKYGSFRKVELSEAMTGGVVTSSVLLLIGVIIIGGWIWKKYKIIKWASIGLLLCTIVRIIISFWRLFERKSIGSFIIVFSVTLFYFYGCVILWSFYQDERDMEIARSLPQRLNDLKELSRDPGESSGTEDRQRRFRKFFFGSSKK